MKQRKVLSAILLSFILFLVGYSAYSAEFIIKQTAYDQSNGNKYTISYSRNLIKIEGNGLSVDFTYEHKDFSPMVYDGVFVLLSTDSTVSPANNLTEVTIFDSKTRAMFSFITDKHLNTDPYLIAVDDDYNIFLRSKDNTNTLYRFSSDGNVTSTDFNSSINQIIRLGKDYIITLTSDGVFELSDSTFQKLSHIPVSTPCTLLNDAEFISADSILYRVENHTLTEIADTNDNGTNTAGSNIISINDSIICVKQDTTVAKLRESLNLKSDELSVIKIDGAFHSSGKLGTGMKVLYEYSERHIVIKGELTGEGNINSRDLTLMMKFLTGECTPDNVLKIAADLDNDNTISVRDLLILSKLFP